MGLDGHLGRSRASWALSRACFTSVLLAAGAASFSWGAGWIGGDAPTPAEGLVDHHFTARWLGAGLLLSAAAFFRLHYRYFSSAVREMEDFGRSVDAYSDRARWIDLAIASALGLFLEVALIRWHGTEFRACAYLKNVTLLACFLGLGLGFARSRGAIVGMPATLALLAAQVLAIDILSLADADRAIRNPIVTEVYWGMGHITSALHLAIFYGFFAALFISTIVVFIPIGQLTGRLMDPASPIKSYTVNVAGSIAGVLAFSAVSYLWLPPAFWFGIVAIATLWLVRTSRVGLAVGGSAAAIMLVWLGFEPRLAVRDIYSPYQRLEIRSHDYAMADGSRIPLGVAISANKTWYMEANDLSDAFVARWGGMLEQVRDRAAAYNLPYRLDNRNETVLIIGAGAGNDVAAALRNGAAHVDAVEIDPAILAIGRDVHPESPYRSNRVRTVLADARAFMKGSPPAQYDLIVFGLLDSHTLLTGMATIRLDNFVYTLESMREARRLLRPGGRLCLSFAAGSDSAFAARIYRMLASAFGHPPRTFTLQGTDTALVVGLDETSKTIPIAGVPESTTMTARKAEELDPPMAIDDWPFPFLAGRHWSDFPRPYLYLIGLLAGISLAWVGISRDDGSAFDGEFFFLGAAFLLVETKGITELALIFGTSWIVTSIVIVSILTLVLLANWAVSAIGISRVHLAYVLLTASLFLGYYIPVEQLLPFGLLRAGIAAAGLLFLPLLFAGIVFGASLNRCGSLPSAFSSNLMGAILGGLCEYSSMVLGFRNLYLVAAAIYGLAWLCAVARSSSASPHGVRRI